uniref:Uncharacterized protein n=1 Tax=viral metagenome TaxID=1070528 RepID=A0A6C0LVA7_9ZZZZ
MTVYDDEKKSLISEQNVLFAKNNTQGVVEKFKELDNNITENCPDDRVVSERSRLQEKRNQWDSSGFSPEFIINKQLNEFDKSSLSVGIANQCTRIGNHFYHIEMSNENHKCINKKNPLVWNYDLLTSDDGVYTWFIFTDTYGFQHLVSKKVLTIHEISTKHSNIISDILDELDTIHFAGEFQKTGNSVELNFLSGTYMSPEFEGLSDIQINGTKDQAVKFLNENFDGEIIFTDQNPVETFITATNIVYTHENIKLLLDCGAVIKRFDYGRTCKLYNILPGLRYTAEAKHEQSVRVWEQIGGVKPIFDYKPPIIAYVVVTKENLDLTAVNEKKEIIPFPY